MHSGNLLSGLSDTKPTKKLKKKKFWHIF